MRWNTFGSVPPASTLISLSSEDEARLLGPGLLPASGPAYVLSLASLTSKAARSASPPLYEDPPTYEVAVKMMHCH